LELATDQHGVVSTRQLATIGYTRSSASKAHGVGRLRRIHRGVYAVGHERLSWEARCMGAVLACSPAIASHLSAAWLWDLLRTRPTTFHLTAPTKRRSRLGIFVHSADLPEVDVAEVDGIPVTALARTMLDSALILDPERLARMIERAEHLKVFDLRAVESLLRRAPRHRGQGPFVEALAIYRDEPAFTRSGLERRFARLVRSADLSRPSMTSSPAASSSTRTGQTSDLPSNWTCSKRTAPTKRSSATANGRMTCCCSESR
jgi:Transcriptional regulator, AbiEi antitoxin